MSKYSFFVYCPDSGFEVFETLDEALDEANDRVQDYLDCNGYWSEDVTDIVVGEITHRSKMCNQRFPDGEIDEDGLDEAGDSWEHGMDYKCDYKMMPVEPAPAVQGEPAAYAVFADNGNIRIWCADPIQAETLRQQYGEALQPLYTAPQPAEQQPAAKEVDHDNQ